VSVVELLSIRVEGKKIRGRNRTVREMIINLAVNQRTGPDNIQMMKFCRSGVFPEFGKARFSGMLNLV
jgi:hypothetical protein